MPTVLPARRAAACQQLDKYMSEMYEHACQNKVPAAEGQQRLDLFKQVAAAPTLTRIGAKLDFSGFNNGDLWIALLTFLFVDFADTTSTMFSMASFLNNFVPGFVRPDKVITLPEV